MFFTRLYKTWLYVKQYFIKQKEQPFEYIFTIEPERPDQVL